MVSKPVVATLAIAGVLAVLIAGVVVFVIEPSESPPPALSLAGVTAAPNLATLELVYTSQPIGDVLEGRPWIAHLAIADLDQDGLPDVLACDALTNSIRWIRQAPRGVFAERQIGGTVKAPAHVATCDIDRDGDLDVLVASMGVIMPNNDPIGAVIVLENLGRGEFRDRVIIEGIARVADVRGADFDGDGDIDLVAGQFGYAQGEIRWLRNDGGWHFTSRQLLGLSGTIHTPVADLDGDNRPDIVALVSQEWEEIHIFRNAGRGEFTSAVVWGSTNEDYGSSGLTLDDLDGDGDLDIIYTNGDAFDYSRPGPRPWHGIQWLENRSGTFKFHRIGNFPGAYSPCCVDVDGNGHKDLIAVSGFNAWDDPNSASMMAWLNDGGQRFTPVVLARSPTHLLALAVGDLDGDGTPELVTGGFHAYPPWDRMSRVLMWKRR